MLKISWLYKKMVFLYFRKHDVFEWMLYKPTKVFYFNSAWYWKICETNYPGVKHWKQKWSNFWEQKSIFSSFSVLLLLSFRKSRKKNKFNVEIEHQIATLTWLIGLYPRPLPILPILRSKKGSEKKHGYFLFITIFKREHIMRCSP